MVTSFIAYDERVVAGVLGWVIGSDKRRCGDGVVAPLGTSSGGCININGPPRFEEE